MILKKINSIVNIITGSFIGVTIGHSIYQYLDYRKFPDLYAMQSAPWYASILVYCGFTALVLTIAMIIKLVLRQKLSNK